MINCLLKEENKVGIENVKSPMSVVVFFTKVTELFLRRKNLIISLVFVSRSYLKVP